MCAVAALKNRTWAENLVYDSDNTPLLDALQNVAKPYVTVFTDTDTSTEIFGRDVYTANRSLALVFEFGVASAVVVDNKGLELRIPQTDQAMEALVDILESQILSAVVSDPYSPFGELLRRMINRFTRIPSIRGGSEQQGTRWAARKLTLMCDTISSPAPGVALDANHPVRDFITMAKSQTYAALGMAEAATLIEQILEGSPSPDWRQGQAWLGLTLEGIQGTAIVPLPEGDEEATLLEDVTVEADPTI